MFSRDIYFQDSFWDGFPWMEEVYLSHMHIYCSFPVVSREGVFCVIESRSPPWLYQSVTNHCLQLQDHSQPSRWEPLRPGYSIFVQVRHKIGLNSLSQILCWKNSVGSQGCLRTRAQLVVWVALCCTSKGKEWRKGNLFMLCVTFFLVCAGQGGGGSQSALLDDLKRQSCKVAKCNL